MVPDIMVQFEYDTTKLNENEPEKQHLKMRGDCGWELVCVAVVPTITFGMSNFGNNSKNEITYYWKREVQKK